MQQYKPTTFRKYASVQSNGPRSSHGKDKKNLFLSAIEQIVRNGSDAAAIIACFQSLHISASTFAFPGAQRYHDAVAFLRNHYPYSNATQSLGVVWRALSAKHNLLNGAPLRPVDAAVSRKGRTMVYMGKNLTQDVISYRQLLEEDTLDTAARLYQYLNWSIRLANLAGFLQTLESRDGRRALLINSELHCRVTGDVLYMLCIPNDFASTKSQKWQFVRLVTARDIQRFAPCYGRGQSLPRGVRAEALQFDFDLETKEQLLSAGITDQDYLQLKGVQTQNNRQREQASRKVLTLTVSQVRRAVRKALLSTHPRHNLIPIVSILSGKLHPRGGFCQDQVLPIQVGDGHDWIGVVFRDGVPQMTLIDAYDICNKAILRSPDFNTHSLDFFRCRYNKVRIEPDHCVSVELYGGLDDDNECECEDLEVMYNSPMATPITSPMATPNASPSSSPTSSPTTSPCASPSAAPSTQSISTPMYNMAPLLLSPPSVSVGPAASPVVTPVVSPAVAAVTYIIVPVTVQEPNFNTYNFVPADLQFVAATNQYYTDLLQSLPAPETFY